MKVHIKRSFDSSCSTYDSSCDIQRMVASHLAGLISNEHNNILEIGTGTGIFTSELALKYKEISITCLDVAHSLLAEAKLKHPDFSYICADAERLPIMGGEKKFDLIASSSTLQWFIRPEKSIPEILSNLKKGGQFGFSVFCRRYFSGDVYPERHDRFRFSL